MKLELYWLKESAGTRDWRSLHARPSNIAEEEHVHADTENTEIREWNESLRITETSQRVSYPLNRTNFPFSLKTSGRQRTIRRVFWCQKAAVFLPRHCVVFMWR
jgi:hypothetical protein